ncbi:MAG: TldD/PmbA family protein [Acidobacteria bacterium]|nr:TldD/PmbA family protein [Acidobacteriota bacterium]
MTNMQPSEPAFDHRWLEALAQWCSRGQEADAGLIDLYIERRLELRLHVRRQARWVEECRTEGAAVRTRTESRHEIVAATGTSPKTIAQLLSGRIDTRELHLLRPLPPPDLDAPRNWKDTVETWVDATSVGDATVLILERRAAVIRPGQWQEIHTPLLIRLEALAPGSSSLLATWNHAGLTQWAALVNECPQRRVWRPSGGDQLPVIFTSGTAGVLMHELVGHLLEGDVISDGGSPLERAEASIVGPPTLTVIDDPTRFDLPGAFSSDDEGVLAEPIHLLSGGVVCGALCDGLTASQLDRAPGRGRRAAWNQAPVPRMSNVVVPPGHTDPEALENDLKNGLVVTRLSGASVDPRSGQVILRVEQGWEIRHGRRRRALAPFELGGDVLGILRSIEPDFGDDPTPDWRLAWCLKAGLPLPTGAEAPTMLVRTMEVV